MTYENLLQLSLVFWCIIIPIFIFTKLRKNRPKPKYPIKSSPITTKRETIFDYGAVKEKHYEEFSNEDDTLTNYKYRARTSVMTPTEERVFRKLIGVFDVKFYIIPQVHLPTILDFKIKGQNWYGAFQHINRKSVDFILLDKKTLTPTCAIELDDYTHNLKHRRKRDREVERIFRCAGLPLVRIKDITTLSNREILNLFISVISPENLPETTSRE